MRGCGENYLLDLRPNTLRILDDLVGPEANNSPTFTFHRRGTSRVRLDLKGMMFAVDLDHKPARDAGEVREVGTDRVLSPEFDAV